MLIYALIRESKAEVVGLNSEVTDLKRKIDTFETSVISKIKTLESSEKKIKCFEEMKLPAEIYQCMSGHLICLRCRERPEVYIYILTLVQTCSLYR